MKISKRGLEMFLKIMKFMKLSKVKISSPISTCNGCGLRLLLNCPFQPGPAECAIEIFLCLISQKFCRKYWESSRYCFCKFKNIGVGAQSTLGARDFCPKIGYENNNKMPPTFTWYLPEKLTKIPKFYVMFARKMSEFYTIIARRIFFPNF